MPESVAASHLREVLDALSAHDLDRVGEVVDEKFEFMDVGGGDTVHSRDEWRAFCDVLSPPSLTSRRRCSCSSTPANTRSPRSSLAAPKPARSRRPKEILARRAE